VILLASIPLGLAVGYALGGRLEQLGRLGFAWAPLAVIGLLVQVVLFTPVGGSLAVVEPILYVASTAAVFVAVIRNVRLTGMPIVALGALSNLVAITLNGGAMPADPAALAAAGLAGPGTNTNSVMLANPAVRPLTDIFAIPAGVPLANVFSVGDVLIGLGIVVVIVSAMRRPAATSRDAPGGGSRAGT
jgi:hypothetical protein